MSPNPSSALSGGVSGDAAESSVTTAGEFMLFGVRVIVDSMRKSVSMNNLSQYEHPNESSNNNAGGGATDKEDFPAGYASADDAVKNNSGGGRDRKRGVPWTEAEHKLFLLGLQKIGKGDWRGISRNFVKTRTPTQVASHAQKYFLRRTNLNRRRRRSSLFDITTDSVGAAIPMDEDKVNVGKKASLSPPLPPTPSEPCNGGGFRVASPYSGTIFAAPRGNPMDEEVANGSDRNSSPQLSLRLSLSCDQRESSTGHSAFQAMPGFNNGESIISVA